MLFYHQTATAEKTDAGIVSVCHLVSDALYAGLI
jgi:hypothetical protein